MRDTAFPCACFGEVYPERRQARPSVLDRLGENAMAWFVRGLRPRWHASFLRCVEASEEAFAGMDRERLAMQLETLRLGLRRSGFRDELIGPCLGLIRMIVATQSGVRPSDGQILASHAVLRGAIAEVPWDERKDLVAAMAASVAALAGVAVHVVTSNEPLARRASTEMQPLFEALGLDAGVVTHGSNPDVRRAAYRCDVTYASAQELVFDYLRDRLVLDRVAGPLRARLDRLRGRQALCPDLRMRGLWFAIVDDADDVLIDDAVRPIALFGDAPVVDEWQCARQAVQAAEQLREGVDYRRDPQQLFVTLTERGRQRLALLGPSLGGLWTDEMRREELVSRALLCLYLTKRDRDYTVDEGRLRLAGSLAGRVAPEPGWRADLRRLLEVREGLAPVAPRQPLARISLQRFFRRYLCLSGIACSAYSAAGELWTNYRVQVVRVTTAKRPSPRPRARICSDVDRKWDALAHRAAQLQERGRPVLIALESASTAHTVADRLSASGLEHTVIGLENPAKDAALLARPGTASGVAVGACSIDQEADWPPFSGDAATTGIHVLVAEQSQGFRSVSRLVRRYMRFGALTDVEAVEVFASVEEIRASGRWSGPLVWLAGQAALERWCVPCFAQDHLLSLLLTVREREKARARCALARADEQAAVTLAFAGRHGV